MIARQWPPGANLAAISSRSDFAGRQHEKGEDHGAGRHEVGGH
jgi:hypothetical protein